MGTHDEDEHDSVGPLAGAVEKLVTADGLITAEGDASTGSFLIGAYLNGPLSACKVSPE